MNKFFLKNLLSTSKIGILDTIFNAKADELAEEMANVTTEEKERFLDVVNNVSNEDLKKRLISSYLKDDDKMGEECARLTKKYYKARHI